MTQPLRLATAAMGTRFEIVIEAGDSFGGERPKAKGERPMADGERLNGSADEFRAVGEMALREIEALHTRLSFHATDSLLSHINRTACNSAVQVDADTYALLRDALQVWRLSDGAFDPARGTGMDAVELDDATRLVRYHAPGVSLDLGAIAKGHAVDAAAAVLREYGVTSALIHGGTSSIAAIGSPAGMQGWGVAIAPSHTARVFLCDSTLSVSSGALRPHIVDPATRAFIEGPRVAAVIGPSARLGDAWATAVAVLGRRPDGMGDEWDVIIE